MDYPKALVSILGTATMAISFSSFAGGDMEEDGTTLPEAVQHTINVHPVIASNQAAYDAAKHAITEQRAPYFPTIDVDGGYGWENSNNETTRGDFLTSSRDWEDYERQEGSLRASQLIFDGFGTPARVKSAKKRAKNAKYQLYNAGEEIGLEATQAFIDVIRRRALTDTADESVSAHKRILGSIKKREEAGYDRRADLYQARSRLSLSQTRQTTQEGELANAISTYTEVVRQEPGYLIVPDAPIDMIPVEVDEAINTAMSNSPAVTAAAANTQATKADITAAKAPFFPTFTFEFSATQNENLDAVSGQNDDFLSIFRVNYNLFRGGADLARTRQAVATHFQAKADEAEIRRQVREDVRLSYDAINTAQKQIERETAHLHSSQQLVKTYAQQFEIGTRSLLALLDAEDERFIADANLANQKYIKLFEEYQLLARMGKLLDYLNVTYPEGYEHIEM